MLCLPLLGVTESQSDKCECDNTVQQHLCRDDTNLQSFVRFRAWKDAVVELLPTRGP